MAIWEKIKNASVEARRKDEEYHARAMHEIQSGKRRDGLLAKAVTSTAGDQMATKLAYFKLLVQAIRDDDKIAQEHALQSSTPLQFPVKKPSLLKTMWFWFLVVLATMIFVFGFLPLRNI